MPARLGNCAVWQVGSRCGYSSADLSGRRAALRPQLCQATLAVRIHSCRSQRSAVRAAALALCAGRSVSGRGTAPPGGACGGASDGAPRRRAAPSALSPKPACFRRGAGACTAHAAGSVPSSTSGGGGGGGGSTPAYTSQGDSADGDPHAQLQKVLRRAAPATYSRARQCAVSVSAPARWHRCLAGPPLHDPGSRTLSRGGAGPRSSAWARTSCPRTFRRGPACLPGTSRASAAWGQ